MPCKSIGSPLHTEHSKPTPTGDHQGSKLRKVIKNIETLQAHPTSQHQCDHLLNYYHTNQCRMDDKKHRKLAMGFIGSGDIEAMDQIRNPKCIEPALPEPQRAPIL